MAIVNGTFDTDLSGWTQTVYGNGDILLDSGRARMRIYQCNFASIKQDFLIDRNTLSFDYQTYFALCPEYPSARITVDGQVIYLNEPMGLSGTPYCVFGYSGRGTETVDLTPYIGKMGTVEFYIRGYPYYCNFSDHADTYFWIDNVKLFDVVPTIGSIEFSSTPTGAKIFIDEIDTGLSAPTTISNLTAGPHTYRLSKFAYFDSIGTIDIIPNTTITISVTMTPMVTTCQVFSSVPKDARIIVDGWDLGVTSPVELCEIPYGYHDYELEGTFTIEEQGRPVQPFVTVPKGSKVYVNGLYMGDTPIIIKDLSPGTYRYRLIGTFVAV
jgi:hypothetical protein